MELHHESGTLLTTKCRCEGGFEFADASIEVVVFLFDVRVSCCVVYARGFTYAAEIEIRAYIVI